MILPKAPKKKKIMISNINQIKCRSKAEFGQPCCMLRSITYKVVNDANDALNVFVEMVSIKLALQSLRENRRKDSLYDFNSQNNNSNYNDNNNSNNFYKFLKI